jgi:MFS family permease
MYVVFPIVMLALYFVPSYPLAIAASAVWGWGGAAMWMGTTLQILSLADRAKKHGTGMGVLYGATHAGWAVGVIVLGAVFGHAQSVQTPWLLYVAATILTLIGYAIMLALPRRPEPLPEMPTWAALWEIMSRSKARIAAFLLFAASLAFGFVLGSFTDYVENAHGAQWLWIATFFYPFARFVLSFSSGLLSERMGHGSVLAVGFFGGAGGMLIPLLWTHPAALAVTALMLGLLNGAVPVVSTALIGGSADQARRPLVYGAMFTWRDLGVVVAAVAGSLLGLQVEGVGLTFGVFSIVFAVCGAVALILNRYAEQQL